MRKKVDGATVLVVGSRYNSKNQLIRNSWRVGAAVFSQDYTYNSLDGSINTVTMPDQTTLTYGYDSLRRLSTVTGGVTAKQYLYRVLEDNRTTNQVTSLSYTALGKAFQYSYDIRGNIATYAAPGKAVVTYAYDKQGQLLSANSNTNSYSYTYDNVGNILTATKNGTTHTYTYSTYDWKDKLIAYDNQPIAYDANGNPTSYYNGTRWAMTWINGRELATATSGDTSLAFAYDGNGLRTSKTVNGVKHEYFYSGGKLLRETYGSNILDFAYNADGSLYSFRYNQNYYYYVTNLQGDVIGLVDAEGATVASYEYDPYGKVISATGDMAAINPMRYRGYYYDAESTLYYLQSRYYDPELGRFINADAYTSTGQGILGNNMFAYCNNNPVVGYDPTGHFSWNDLFNTAAVVTVAAIAVIAIIASGGSAAPPLLATASALAGTTVTATAATTVATGVAITGMATMGAAATASILESSSKQGKDYVQAKNNKQANQWAQEVGYDGAEELKADYVGKQGSKFNMYTDRATGQIILIALKTAKEIVTQLFRW